MVNVDGGDKKLTPIGSRRVFTGGASNRHFGTVLDAAHQLPDVSFHIATSREVANGLQSIPSNEKVLLDLDAEEFRSEIDASSCVVLPLKPNSLKSGQLVALQAMKRGRVLFFPSSSALNNWIAGFDTLDFVYAFA